MSTLQGSSKNVDAQDESDIYKSLSQKTTGQIYGTLFDYLQNETKNMGLNISFYTLDFGDIFWKIHMWRKSMPGIRPFFAVKTNSDPTLLRLLTMLQFSFDCASEGELKLVMKAGADPRNVILAHPIKTLGALKYAKEIGVDLLTFDSEEELFKIHGHYPNARLLLRLIPDAVNCVYDLSEKFGCHPDDAPWLLERAKNLDLNVIGVSFHVGGLCQKSMSYTSTIRTSKLIFTEAQKLGFHFSILDIGGGFLGAKGTEEIFNKITQEIGVALKLNFPENDIEVIAEPGTYFVASAGNLITGIIGKKKITNRRSRSKDKDLKNIERFYYLNDSIYGSFFSGVELYGMEWKPLLDKSQLSQRQVCKSKLWGQSCCGDDVIVKECMLPDMEEGEYLIWHNMGAYTQVLCSSFCGVPIPPHKHIFIKDNRLTMENVTNVEDIKEFISRSCTLIDNK